jgi:tetratricopeptide (TPR) repeat protein
MQARWILADPTRGAQAAAAMTLGYRLAERDDAWEAESLFRQALADPGSGFAAAAAVALGDLLSTTGDDERAEAAFREALALGVEPDRRPAVWLRVGRLAAARSDFRSAREAFDTVLDDADAESLHAEAVAALGKLYENNGDTSAAAANYRLLTALTDPTWTPIGQARLAVLLQRAGDIDGATDQYRAALTGGHPTMAPAAGIDLAALLRDQGRTEEAVNIYRQVIALNHPEQTPKHGCASATSTATRATSAGRATPTAE